MCAGIPEKRAVAMLSFPLDGFHQPFLEFSVNNYWYSFYDLGKLLPVNKETKVERG